MTLRTRDRRVGSLLIATGTLLLTVQLFGWTLGWPLFILVPGALLLLAAGLGGASVAALFVPGSVITTVGLILSLQSLTDYFRSWAYAWALVPAAVGVGLFLYGRRSGDAKMVSVGRRLAGGFAAIFLVATALFEGFVFNDLADTWPFRTGVPLLLIAAGLWLLRRRGEP